jgi:hypothetical protein
VLDSIASCPASHLLLPVLAYLLVDVQRIRFMTSIIFEATISCEFITPFFPQVRMT